MSSLDGIFKTVAIVVGLIVFGPAIAVAFLSALASVAVAVGTGTFLLAIVGGVAIATWSIAQRHSRC